VNAPYVDPAHIPIFKSEEEETRRRPSPDSAHPLTTLPRSRLHANISRLKDVKNPLPDYEDVPSSEKEGIRAWFRPGRLWVGEINIPGPMGADSSAGYVFQVVEWNARDEVWVVSHAAHGDEQLCHLKLDDNVRPDGSLGLSFADAETSCVGSISPDGVISGTVGQLVRPEEDFWQKAGDENTFTLRLAACEACERASGAPREISAQTSRMVNAVKARVARLARWRVARVGLPLVFDGMETIRCNTGQTDAMFTHLVNMRESTRNLLDPDPVPFGLVEWVIQRPPRPGMTDQQVIAEEARKRMGVGVDAAVGCLTVEDAIRVKLQEFIERLARDRWLAIASGEDDRVNVSERLEKETGGLILADREAWVRSTIIEAHQRFVSERGTPGGSPAKADDDEDEKEKEDDGDGLQTHPVLDMSESEGEEEEEDEEEEEEEDHASLPSLVDSDEESNGDSSPPSLISTDDSDEEAGGDAESDPFRGLDAAFARWEEDDVYDDNSGGRGWTFGQILRDAPYDGGVLQGERVWWRVWQTLMFACEAECCRIRERTRSIKEAKFATFEEKKAAVSADRENNGTRADIHAAIGLFMHRQYALLWRSINFSELPDRDAQECNKTIVEMIHQTENRMYIAYRAFDDASRKFESRLPRSDVERRCLTVPPEGIGAVPGFEEPESADCTICMTTLNEPGETLCRLDCGHGFHVECLESWLHNERTCPNCRTKVIGEGDVEEEEEEARREEERRRESENNRRAQDASSALMRDTRQARANGSRAGPPGPAGDPGDRAEELIEQERAVHEAMTQGRRVPPEFMQAMRAIGRVAINRLGSGQEMPSMEELSEMMSENPEFVDGERITTDRLIEMFTRMVDGGEEEEDDESEEEEDDESEEEGDDDSFDSESDGSSWLTDSGDSSEEESDDFEVWRQRAREFGLYQRMPEAMRAWDDPDRHADDRQMVQDSDEEAERDPEELEAWPQEIAESLLGPDIPPELISDDENDSPDSEENARPRTRARTAARRALRPPPRVHSEAQDVD
tara:strand:- start:132 stop:3215 length:3084 start_codon:yes stop_codon:yes gene_type:complete